MNICSRVLQVCGSISVRQTASGRPFTLSERVVPVKPSLKPTAHIERKIQKLREELEEVPVRRTQRRMREKILCPWLHTCGLYKRREIGSAFAALPRLEFRPMTGFLTRWIQRQDAQT